MAEKMSESEDEKFEDILTDHPTYGPHIAAKGKYEVWAAHDKLHWFLMIRRERQPFFTIEIRSETGENLIRTVRDVQEESNKFVKMFSFNMSTPEKVGIYETDKTLRDICAHADDVVKEMDYSYDLATANCQNFCNKLLTKLGFGTFPTTFDDIESITGDDNAEAILTEGNKKRVAQLLNKFADFDKPAKVYML